MAEQSVLLPSARKLTGPAANVTEVFYDFASFAT